MVAIRPRVTFSRRETHSSRERRESLGLSQAQLAQRAGLTSVSVSRIETGHLPRLATLAKLAVALGCDLSALLS